MTTKTVQLRRYVIVDGELDAFVEWWRTRLVAARRASGFTVEFGYALPASNEFVWAVSVDGDAERFATVDEAYVAGEARAAAFDGVPQRVASMVLEFADPVI